MGKNLFYLIGLFVYLFIETTVAYSQDCLLQGWYWEYPKTSDGALWADTVVSKTMDISNSGFTYVWLPPLSRSSSVPNNNSNGYNVKDLFDLGEYGLGATGFGSRQNVNNVINTFGLWNVNAVADVIYNHRDGGAAETNPSVEGWVENYPGPATNCAYPSDRFRCFLPVGGSSNNNSGDYYIKISSKSQDPAFYNKTYKLYITTNRASVALPYNGSMNEDEVNGGNGNGGGDCGQQSNSVPINSDVNVTIDNSGCLVDEFKITLDGTNYYTAGDTLWFYLSNNNGDYSDHRIYGIWNASAANDVVSQLHYQTYTNFYNLPSGRGSMTHANFRPNGSPTTLCGDSEWPWFFYDYDHNVPSTRDTLVAYTKWLWSNVGIRGLRMDAVKHFDPYFVSYLLNNMNAAGQNPGLVVGESISSATQISDWINAVYANMTPAAVAAVRVRAFDFPLRWSLKNACDQFGYDVRQVFNEGLTNGAGQSAFNVVTFINNHDYRNSADAVQNDPMLAYAYLLTNNKIGLPSVFYPDYYGSNLNYMPTAALKPQIDALLNVHRHYIYGSANIDYLSRFSTPYSQNFISGYPNTTLVYQLWGTPNGNDVVVAINFAGETMRVDHGLNTGTGGLAVGDSLVDVLGRSNFPYAIVNSNSQMYIELPPRSYSVWVRCNSPSAPDCIPAPSGRFRGKVWLQGPYLPTQNIMSAQLKNSGLLPLSQPYNTTTWGYSGTEHVSEARVLPPNTIDWVLVEARSSSDTTLLARQAAFVRADGIIIDQYGLEGVNLPGTANGQSYFIAIKHRNHLSVMSSSPITLGSNMPVFDFGQLGNIAGGASQAVLLGGSHYGMAAADAQYSGTITFRDFNTYYQQLGSSNTYSSGDLNMDGQISATDFTLYRQNAGRIALPVLR